MWENLGKYKVLEIWNLCEGNNFSKTKVEIARKELATCW